MNTGRTTTDDNVSAFLRWVATQTAADARATVSRSVLNRGEKVDATSVVRSSVAQTRTVSHELKEPDTGLRARGVLRQVGELEQGDAGADEPEQLGSRDQAAAGAMSSRIESLEQQVSVQRAEITEQRTKLKTFDVIESVLARAGWLP